MAEGLSLSHGLEGLGQSRARAAAVLAWRFPLALGALAGAISAALLWLGPPGNDTAAHVYQLWLFQHHGLTPWDNYWYSGRWVFVTYSLMYYPLAAIVGIKPLAVLSIAIGAAAFARLVRWKPAAVTFAVVWGAYTISGAYPFMLGAAFALPALLTRRVWLFALLAALTWAASPLAVLMLAVAVVGMRRRKESLITLGLIALQVVLAHIFHGRGHFPFPWPEILASLVFSVGGAILARDRALRGIFIAYTALVVLAVAFQSQLGENAARLRFAALPLSLLVVRGHRLWIAVPLVALCASYNITPLVISYDQGRDERAHNHSFWVPAIDFLRAHEDPNFRVNAVDTVGHWEAVHHSRGRLPDHARLVPAGRLPRERDPLLGRPEHGDVRPLAARARRPLRARAARPARLQLEAARRSSPRHCTSSRDAGTSRSTRRLAPGRSRRARRSSASRTTR